MSKRKSIVITTLCSILFLSACSSDSETAAEPEAQSINVEIGQVQLKSLDAISSFSGTLEPVQDSMVSFEVGGVIATMDVNVGDAITAGQVLATLEATDMQLQLQQAEAAVISASSAVTAAQANIESANALISSANASLKDVNDGAREQEEEQARLSVENAQNSYDKLLKDFERIQTLYDQGIVSLSEYENMELQLASAEKNLQLAQESYSLIMEGATEAQRQNALSAVEQAEASKKAAEASLAQAQATYQSALIGQQQAQRAYEKTQLKAPFDGVVLSKVMSEGEQVGAGDPIFTIGNIDTLKVLLPVPDRDIHDWVVGDEVTIRLYDEQRSGTVTKIHPLTNAGTGTISVEVVIPNAEMTWLPGQVVSANITKSDNAGLFVPISAVLSSGSEPYVYKVEDGVAVKTSVETGSLNGNELHIISGLEEGEEVVVRGGELLMDGDPVQMNGGNEE